MNSSSPGARALSWRFTHAERGAWGKTMGPVTSPWLVRLEDTAPAQVRSTRAECCRAPRGLDAGWGYCRTWVATPLSCLLAPLATRSLHAALGELSWLHWHSKGPSQSIASLPRLSSEARLLCGIATALGHRALGHTFGMSDASRVAELSVFSVLGGLAWRGFSGFSLWWPPSLCLHLICPWPGLCIW